MIGSVGESALLHDHGTVSDQLPAGAILGAAVRDLYLRENAADTENGEGVRYAFVAAHVRACKGSVIRLFEKAIQGQHKGLQSSKLNTRRIYASVAKLNAAKALAKERNIA